MRLLQSKVCIKHAYITTKSTPHYDCILWFGFTYGFILKILKIKSRKWCTKLVNVGNICSYWQWVKIKDSWLLWMCGSNALRTCIRLWRSHQSYSTEPCLCDNKNKETKTPNCISQWQRFLLKWVWMETTRHVLSLVCVTYYRGD